MRKRILLPALLGWLAATCIADARPSELPVRGSFVADVATLAEPDQRYSLYLPPGYDASSRWPVLILLDARGRGESTLQLAEAAASRNGWVVLSSRNSRSDADENITLRALQALLRETGQRYAYDPRRIYLAGFSGTAKTLWTQVTPLRHVIAGLFGNGGGRPPELGAIRQAPPAFFGTTGLADFNYQEMRALDDSLAEAGAVHRLEVFDGPHGWPPSSLFGDALDWFDLMAMRDGRLARDEAWIDAQLAARRARIEAEADALAKWRALGTLARDFEGLRDVSLLRRRADELAAGHDVLARRAQEERLRGEEKTDARRLDAWIARIEQRDPSSGRRADPPTPGAAMRELRIAALVAASRDPDPARAASARRRLERIAVAVGFYLPVRYQAQRDLPRAAALLEIAVAIQPDRAGHHWRLAEVEARSGRKDAAFEALAAARGLRQVDAESLASDPAWASLRNDPRWAAASAPLP